jgi:hypothetical protein
MDWWDTVVFPQEKMKDLKVEITYLPSQHFSARGVTDRNRTLW